MLPDPASARSRKRKRPLKEGLRNASSDRRPRPPDSEMGEHVDLQHTQINSETIVKNLNALCFSQGGRQFWQFCSDVCVHTWAVIPAWQRDRAGPAECGTAPLQFQPSPERAAGPQNHPPLLGCPTLRTTDTETECKQKACASHTLYNMYSSLVYSAYVSWVWIHFLWSWPSAGLGRSGYTVELGAAGSRGSVVGNVEAHEPGRGRWTAQQGTGQTPASTHSHSPLLPSHLHRFKCSFSHFKTESKNSTVCVRTYIFISIFPLAVYVQRKRESYVKLSTCWCVYTPWLR